MALADKPPGYLRRLNPGQYRGRAWVHWVMAIDRRLTGWLDDAMHAQVRELLVHACARYRLACPAYCLMPDHGHFLWMGLAESSDQLKAVKFFRKQWNLALSRRGVKLQQQPFEHVLHEHERNQSEFEDTIAYILANAERAGRAAEWINWKHLGTVVAGYPNLDPREREKFPSNFWRIHHLEVERLQKEVRP